MNELLASFAVAPMLTLLGFATTQTPSNTIPKPPPGPHDSGYLFERFVTLLETNCAAAAH